MSGWALGWRLLARQWRSLHLVLLVLAVVVAASSLSTVGFLSGRLDAALKAQANQLLGADLVISADHPLPETVAAQARAEGLHVTQTVILMSMASHADQMRLSVIKAVSPGYPLRGSLKTGERPDAVPEPTREIPPPGEAWVEPRLMPYLNVGVGDTLQLGGHSFRISRFLLEEPDKGLQWLNIAPRILINTGDLDATGLVVPGARITYRLLVAGPAEGVARFRNAVEPGLARGAQVQTIDESRPELRDALLRGSRYLNLVALTALVLAMTAIALAARGYQAGQMQVAALMRCLGAGRRQIFVAYTVLLGLLGLLGSGIGLGIGLWGQAMLADLFTPYLELRLPPPGVTAALTTLLTCLLTLYAVALPPLLALRNSPPVSLIRNESASGALLGKGIMALGLAAVLVISAWLLQSAALVAGFFLGSALALGLAMLLGRGVRWLLGRLEPIAPQRLRWGLRGLLRSGWLFSYTLALLTVGGMVILTLTAVRTSLYTTWQQELPARNPNWFLIQIQPDEIAAVRQKLEGVGVRDLEIYPMIRARLERINTRTVSASAYKERRAKRFVEREFNLSEAAVLSPGNTVTAGRIWTGSGAPELSVDQEIAELLGIRLGDTLHFDVAGQPFAAKVTSLRKIRWDTMRANFFVLARPGSLAGMPRTYIANFYLPPDAIGRLGEVVRDHPGIGAVDMSAMVVQIRRILDVTATAVEVVFRFSLLAGALVLVAGFVQTLPARRQEAGLLKALGTSRRALIGRFVSELALLGGLAGAGAAIAATAVHYYLARQIFSLPFTPLWEVILHVPLGGAVLFGTAGLLLGVRLSRLPAGQILRET